MSSRIIGGAATALAVLAFAAPAGATTPTDPSCNGTISNAGQTSTFVQAYLGLAGPGLSYAGPQGVSTVVVEVDCPAGK